MTDSQKVIEASESIADIPERFIAAGFLRLAANGAWLFKDSPITNEKMQRFLFAHMRRNKEGGYWIVNGPQRVPVEIDDVPYFVTRIEPAEGELRAYICDDTQENLDLSTLSISEDHAIYVAVKNDHAAKLTRNAHNQICEFLVETVVNAYAIRWNGRDYPLTSDRRSGRPG